MTVTARSMEVAQFMMTALHERDSVPTMREICEHFGWASLNSAQTHFDSLVAGGVIEKLRGKARGYRFKDRAHFKSAEGM